MSDTKEAIAKFGEPLEYRQFDEPLANLFDMPVVRAKNALSQAQYQTGSGTSPISTEVIYVGNLALNAFARHAKPSQCLICFFSGAMVALLDACTKLASRMDAKTGLPVHEGEKLLVYPDRLILLESQQRPASQDAHSLHESLRSIARRNLPNTEFAVLLFELTSWFIAMHEGMHIILGHAGYVRDRLQLDGLLEFSEMRQEKIPYDVSQMMEFSADRHAARGVVRRILEGDLDSSYDDALLSNLEVDRKLFLVRTATTALTLLFHLFPKRFCSIEHLLGSHPHPYVRMQWTAMELGHEVKDEVDFPSAIMRPLAEIAATLKSNFDSPDNWWEYAESDLRTKGQTTPPTDLLYHEILAITKEKHKDMAQFAPVYPELRG